MARFPTEPTGWRKNDILSQLHLDSIINHPCSPPDPFVSFKITIRILLLLSIVMLVFHRAYTLFGHRGVSSYCTFFFFRCFFYLRVGLKIMICNKILFLLQIYSGKILLFDTYLFIFIISVSIECFLILSFNKISIMKFFAPFTFFLIEIF